MIAEAEDKHRLIRHVEVNSKTWVSHLPWWISCQVNKVWKCTLFTACNFDLDTPVSRPINGKKTRTCPSLPRNACQIILHSDCRTAIDQKILIVFRAILLCERQNNTRKQSQIKTFRAHYMTYEGSQRGKIEGSTVFLTFSTAERF